MSLQNSNQALQQFRQVYAEIERQVQRALHVHLGDQMRLGEVRERVIAFIQSAEQHGHVFTPAELSTLRQNGEAMITDLDNASHISADPPDAPPPPVVEIVRTGRRGRPRKRLERGFLRQALELRGPVGIARGINEAASANGTNVFASARTVRREALRNHFVEPGEPVHSTETHADGSTTHTYTSTTAPVSTLSDDELDACVAHILQTFPNAGRSMIKGSLKARGHNVPFPRISESYTRVQGAPAVFGRRPIQRRRYKVAGANSLWHHDGQHGLIHFKIVFHCFIDGKSRLIVGFAVNSNNRASSVLDLFNNATSQYGFPSRCRGDHGTENVDVARKMDEVRGLGRGSYIWGRSVHNTRIERLWYDVTQKFGRKWKEFFRDLEANHGFNPTIPSHIWLLHHLFLRSIQQDADEFVLAWNSHKLQIRGERTQSPREMFFFSMLQDGARGIHLASAPVPVDEPLRPEEMEEYGVDWEAINDDNLMNHHREHNPQDYSEFDAQNPTWTGPTTMSEVLCEAPDAILTNEEIQALNAHLFQNCNLQSRSMVVRRQTWITALEYCLSH
ncbi:hypothetical protein EIP91_007465 [Steccherinum ochraceum]|uniref:Integrase catalytic domain-containing protein n=1 Tax=Steccherinum ochraceum TaxID=92696 RepID=A0A4R0R4A1_9APHY|nr:hypothetical protein EIP91_007465 [Steccherinum ochraceum]